MTLPTVSIRSAAAPQDDPRVVRALEEYAAALQSGDPPDRAAFLAGLPADVAAALGDCLDGLAFVHAVAPHLSQSDGGGSGVGDRLWNLPLGDYRLIREVGRGGMGIVYEAEQLSLRRRVALKVLPFAATMDAKQLQRFRNEALAAASLHHEHIVPVYAVGCERGVHYYAMQFIDGVTLATVIDGLYSASASGRTGHHTPNGPDGAAGAAGAGGAAGGRPAAAPTAPVAARTTLRSRPDKAHYRRAAELIAEAADALEHAHSLGIVHRDVKPGNLLVDANGKVWVADFGLARFGPDAGLTMSGDLLGTLRYIAPEQALSHHGLVDHRADVYALGATLYELLTGKPAVDAAERAEVLRKIAFEDPTPLRKVDKAIPAELETITLKGLAKNPNDRYATAGGLADDLRRWLEDQPIKAKPPGLHERAAKWGRRHKHLVGSAVAVLGVAIVALAVGTCLIWQKGNEVRTAYEAETRERARAQANLGTACDAVDRMLRQIGERRLAHIPQMEKVRADLLNDALAFYQRLIEEQSEDKSLRAAAARAHDSIGTVQGLLGRPSQGIQAYHRSIDILRAVVAEAPDDPRHSHQLAGSLNNLARLVMDVGDLAVAERAYREALDIEQSLVNGHPRNQQYRLFLANMHNNLAIVLARTNRLPEAEGSYRRAADLYEKLAKETSKNLEYRSTLADCQENLADVLLQTGRPSDGEAAYREALALNEQLVKDAPEIPEYRYNVASCLNNLANLFNDTGRFAESEAALKKALPIGEELVAAFPLTPHYADHLATLYLNRGRLLRLTNRPTDAEPAFRRAVTLLEKLVRDIPQQPSYRRGLATTYSALGILLQAGRLGEAEEASRKALAIVEKLVEESPQSAEDQSQLGAIQNNLAITLLLRGDPARARTFLEQAIGHQQAALRGNSKNPKYRLFLSNHYCKLGETLVALGEHRPAASVWRKGLELFPGDVEVLNSLAWLLATSPDPEMRDPSMAIAYAKKAVAKENADGLHNTLGVAYFRAGNWTNAVAELETSIKLNKGGTSFDWFFLAMARWQLGERERAVKDFAQAVEWMEKNRPNDDELRRFRSEAEKLLGIPAAPENAGPARPEP